MMAGSTKIAAIVVAAGRGERAGGDADLPKQYRLLAGKPVLTRTVEALLAIGAMDHVQVVLNPDHLPFYENLRLADPRMRPPVMGASTRQGSVLAGLEALEALEPGLVLIQDAARPLLDETLVAGVLAALETSPAALPVVAVTDTIKRSVDGHKVAATEDRRTLFAAQTPQGFHYRSILEAHRRAAGRTPEFTDDAAIAEWAGLEVALTRGSTRNMKITHAEDFQRAERLLNGERIMETRIGSGFDVHPFTSGDGVWLGGVRIAHHHGLEGHSDADAALHALTDAIYGALGEGDIGHHFPPSDPQWRGAASSVFLAHAAGIVNERKGRIVNLDLTIVCEAPRINPHVAAMKARIASICGIAETRLAIKATTSEKLGFIGREEGIVALATASVELPRED
jgi:2-C-methyl-D-erythritol 4-phosphate cytidylyltransferase/2-C-methyl-D-erythritol 2,4-cyclodiphosphate synthase